MNLIDNAVKHTQPGDEITLGSAVDGDRARLWVADSGPGIHQDEANAIFERFRRGRSGTAGYDGTGLGLAIAQAIARAHGGDVRVVSKAGDGARFEIVIPVEQDPIVEADLESERI